MARLKSTVTRLLVDSAGRLHKCQHNRLHEIRKGDTRLKLIEGRTEEHFCRACALAMVRADIAKLEGIAAELEDAAAAGARMVG